MEREEFLQSIKDKLEAAGFLVDDLVNFCREQESQGGEKKFAFEVMYEGLIRSWIPLKGKKPLGVIFKNHLIALHDAPEKMNWDDAMKYCKRVKIEGYVCNAGEIGFWKKLVGCSEQRKKALDNLLVSLGGVPLNGKRFWSTSEYSNLIAWQWGFICDDENYDYEYKGAELNSRPVLDLSKVSL